jgi:outer membrane protein assembly factor BamB
LRLRHVMLLLLGTACAAEVGTSDQPLGAKPQDVSRFSDEGSASVAGLHRQDERSSYLGAAPRLEPGCQYEDMVVTQSDGQLLAIEPRLGTKLWGALMPEGSSHRLLCPAQGGAIFVLSTAYDAASWPVTQTLSAVDRKEGQIIWTHRVGRPEDLPADGSWSLLLLGSSSTTVGIEELRPGASWVKVLDAATGALRWSHAVATDAEAPVLDAEGRVYVQRNDDSKRHAVSLLDPTTGNVKWTIAQEGEDQLGVTFGRAGRTYLATSHALRKIDPETGASIWTYAKSEVFSPTFLEDGRVLASWRGPDGTESKASLIDDDGRALWYRCYEHAPHVAVDERARIYLVARTALSRLDASDGTIRWTYDYTPSSPLDALVSDVHGDGVHVFVAYLAKGRFAPYGLIELDAETGRPSFKTPTTPFR